MSLVDAFIGENFALICGDTRLVKRDGDYGIIKKVLRTSNNIIFGFTGDVGNNIDFFSPFIIKNLNIDEEIISRFTFNEVVNFLNHKYEEYIHNTELSKGFDICSIVVGFNGEKFIAMEYIISPNKKECVKIEYKSHEGLKIAHLGKEEHLYTLLELHEQNKEPSIDNLVNLFQKTIDKGVEFDNSINNIMIKELIYIIYN